MPNQHTGGPGPIAIQARDQILKRLANGELMIDIAASLGVSPSAVSQVLSKDPEYVTYRKIGIQVQLDKFEQQIADAQNEEDVRRGQLKLACAREGRDGVRWRAEREFPEFALTTKVIVDNVAAIDERLRKSRERVIEGSCVVDKPQQIERK